MTIENAGVTGKARVFQCPNCREYINTHMTECRFCHTPISATDAQAAATKLDRENNVEEPIRGDRDEAMRNMTVGGLWCVGGLVVTGITYGVASSGSGGGSYVVAWGAIIFGGIQFLRGLFQMLSS